MIFSKTINQSMNKTSHNYLFTKMYDLKDCRYEPNTVYWYDQHDLAIRNVYFSQFIDAPHWGHLKKDPTAKILLYFGNEYFNDRDIEMWVSGIISREIDPSQVYLVTVDSNWETWARKQFSKRGIDTINITNYNHLLLATDTMIPSNTEHRTRFSLFSRSYNDWRCKLLGNLVYNNLIDQFTYSFSNIQPYSSPITVIPVDKVRATLESAGIYNKQVKRWTSGLPYSLPNSKIYDKWTNETFEILRSTDIHVLIESHFDPYYTNLGERDKYDVQEFSPAFPTEKTYKVLGMERPFIAFTTPYFMKEIVSLGYKTFHPYINEAYDNIENDEERLSAIVSEISRLHALSDDEIKKFNESVAPIVEHNRQVLIQNRDSVKFVDQFEWINSYINWKNYQRLIDNDMLYE